VKWVRLVLSIAPRLVALYALSEAISVLLDMLRALSPMEMLLAAASSPASVILFVSSALALICIITRSIVAYAVSLVLLAIGKGMAGYLLYPTPFIGLGIMLVLDTISTGYREGQGRSVKIGGREYIAGVAGMVVVLALVVGGGVFAGYAMAYLTIKLLEMSPGPVGAMPVVTQLLSNPFVKLAIVSLLATVFYKFLTYAIDTVTLFAMPSRKASLAVLANRRDIDVVLDVPLSTIFALAVAAVVVPAVYGFVYHVAYPYIVGALYSIPYTGLVLGLVSYFITSYVVVFYTRSVVVDGINKKHIAIPATIALMLYAMGVVEALGRGYTLTQALISPSFDNINKDLASSYISFYTLFFYLVEVFGRLLGVAP